MGAQNNCIEFPKHPSLNRHLNLVEGFECLNDPRGYVVWGLNAPVWQSRGPTLEPGLGSGLVGERLVAGLLFEGHSRAKPEQERDTQGHSPVGPPPAAGTMRDWCKEDRVADEGGDLDGLISGCLGWL
ncbi:hypothetical protein CRENBAI_004091 [Crenichthys baileyi]|uniref:Uncharacterized protein n=1 Tax=Crenichthys baileyi TaxID=28760 RepID=A0AAV9SCM5_9TELE